MTQYSGPSQISLNESTVMSWSIQMDAALRGLVRIAVVVIVAAGCSAEPEDAQLVEPYNEILMRGALDVEIGEEVQMREILFAPGWTAPRHFHNSDLFIYVIAGEFEVDMEGAGLKTYTDGQALRMKPNTPMDARNSSG
jgi:quercetin dioxygenase-like cupin family protein